MFENCVLFAGMDIQYCDEHHSVLINDRLVKFSNTEYKSMRLLLLKQYVSDRELFAALELSPEWENSLKNVTCLMSRIRGKLSAHGLVITRAKKEGYGLQAHYS